MSNTIRPHVDGPLSIEGDFELFAEDGTPIEKVSQAWLCRCGQSANKPFCDGTHKAAGFSDQANVTTDYRIKRPVSGAAGPGVRLTIRTNGPIGCVGQMRVTGVDGSGWDGDQANLCRCGQSANKPFCDGAHRDAGFEAP